MNDATPKHERNESAPTFDQAYPPLQSNWWLFRYMSIEHDMTLLDSELEDIINLCEQIIKARERKRCGFFTGEGQP